MDIRPPISVDGKERSAFSQTFTRLLYTFFSHLSSVFEKNFDIHAKKQRCANVRTAVFQVEIYYFLSSVVTTAMVKLVKDIFHCLAYCSTTEPLRPLTECFIVVVLEDSTSISVVTGVLPSSS